MYMKMQQLAAWRKLLAFLLLISGTVVAYSLVYNYPIRFRPKWTGAPKSIDVLHRAGEKPDNIVLTPSFDMESMATITWRTSDEIDEGVVEFARVDAGEPVRYERRRARLKVLYSPELKSDRVVHCHTAALAGLVPGAAYRYRVGSADGKHWSGYRAFATAPDDPDSFSFVYFGDTQVKIRRFARMLRAVEKRHPEAAFYLVGGDLVDEGDIRNLWDDFMEHTEDAFSRKPVAPALGNHDIGKSGFGQGIFDAYFGLPLRNADQPYSSLNYSFNYGNVSFIVVNSLAVDRQTRWLEEELRRVSAEGECDFKVVMFHVPVYRPRPGSDNRAAQERWVPLFDRYGVDLVLTGHDHSYMRSKRLRGGEEVPGDQPGTVYVVATSCEKFHPVQELDVAEVQLADVATYQLISSETDADGRPRLSYKSCNADGEVLDRFEVRRQGPRDGYSRSARVPETIMASPAADTRVSLSLNTR